MTTKAVSFALPFVTLFAMACSSPDEARVDSRQDQGREGTTDNDRPMGGSPGVREESPYKSFERFEIPINKIVSVGSFDLHLENALVWPAPANQEPRLGFTFKADNNSWESQLPLRNYTGENLVLEIAGKYFYGYLDSPDEVPGLRTGENTFWWKINDPDITLEEIKTGVVTIGSGRSNQVVIPLQNPEETISMQRVPLDAIEVENIQFGHRAVFDNNRLQFSSYSSNELWDEGKAILVLDGTLFGGTRFSCVESDNSFITGPDGLSRVAIGGRECIDVGEVEDFQLRFEVEEPYAGTYEITIGEESIYPGDEDVTFEIVIPESAN